jgi:hypothetical protein
MRIQLELVSKDANMWLLIEFVDHFWTNTLYASLGYWACSVCFLYLVKLCNIFKKLSKTCLSVPYFCEKWSDTTVLILVSFFTYYQKNKYTLH